MRIRVLSVVIALFATPWLASQVFAYGPGTHVREGQTYIQSVLDELPPDGAQGDRVILEDPDFVPFLLIGSMFPDVARQVDGAGYEPHRLDLNSALLHATDDWQAGDEALRAFLLGCALHSASDSVAQVWMTPYFTASTDVGIADALLGAFDGPGGENEFFVEALGDFYLGDLHTVVDLFFMLTDGADAPLALRPVLVAYYTLVEAELGDLPMTPEEFADGVDEVLSLVSDIVGGLPPDAAHDLVDSMQGHDPEEFFEVLAGPGAAFFGFAGVSLDGEQIDPLERERLLANPFIADPQLYATYSTWFGTMGPAFLRDWFDSAEVFTNWRTWHGPPLLAANLQSLAWYLPESHAPDPSVLVWSLEFQDGEGQALGPLSPDDLPTTAQAVISVFPATTADAMVRVEVRAHRFGFETADDPVVGSFAASLSGLPELGAPPHRIRLTVPFAPSDLRGDVESFYLAVFNDVLDPDRPFLTTLEAGFAGEAGVDLTRSVWRPVFDGFAQWQPTLRVEPARVSRDTGVLDVRVRSARVDHHPVASPTLTLARDTDDGLAFHANDVGRLIVEPASPGTWRVQGGTAPGWQFARSEPVEITPGAVGELRVEMEPVPVVDDRAQYSTDGSQIRGRVVNGERFSSDDTWLYAVSHANDADDLSWTDNERSHFTQELAPSVEDGDVRYVFMRAAARSELPPGPVGVSDGVVYDGSPPEAPAIDGVESWAADASSLDVRVVADDPHSGIGGMRLAVRIESDQLLETESLDLAATVDRDLLPDGVDSITLSAVVWNGAGLDSEATEVAVPVEWPTVDVEVDGDTDDAEPDAGSVADQAEPVGDAPDATTAGDDGCGCAVSGRAAGGGWWWLLVAVSLAVRRRLRP